MLSAHKLRKKISIQKAKVFKKHLIKHKLKQMAYMLHKSLQIQYTPKQSLTMPKNGAKKVILLHTLRPSLKEKNNVEKYKKIKILLKKKKTIEKNESLISSMPRYFLWFSQGLLKKKLNG